MLDKGGILRDPIIGRSFLRAGMTVDADRRDRTLVGESKKESGGERIACSRLKCRPKKSKKRQGSSIDFFQLIVHPKICKSWIVCCVRITLRSGESARMIQSSR